MREYRGCVSFFYFPNIKVIFPLFLFPRERNYKTGLATESLNDNGWSVEIFSCSILFKSDVDTKLTPPNLAFMKKRLFAGRVKRFLFYIPVIKIFFHGVVVASTEGVSTGAAATTVTTREAVPVFPAASVAE